MGIVLMGVPQGLVIPRGMHAVRLIRANFLPEERGFACSEAGPTSSPLIEGARFAADPLRCFFTTAYIAAPFRSFLFPNIP
jgi:hypothetical protein